MAATRKGLEQRIYRLGRELLETKQADSLVLHQYWLMTRQNDQIVLELQAPTSSLQKRIILSLDQETDSSTVAGELGDYEHMSSLLAIMGELAIASGFGAEVEAHNEIVEISIPPNAITTEKFKQFIAEALIEKGDEFGYQVTDRTIFSTATRLLNILLRAINKHQTEFIQEGLSNGKRDSYLLPALWKIIDATDFANFYDAVGGVDRRRTQGVTENALELFKYISKKYALALDDSSV